MLGRNAALGVDVGEQSALAFELTRIDPCSIANTALWNHQF
jgi:hypothetical protein